MSGLPAKPRISAILTSFNRRALTLESLHALHASAEAGGAALSIFLVDDGSRDGTGDAVAAAFPNATVIRGDGSLYWNGGMRLAWDHALVEPADFFLWVNDDLVMRPTAIRDALGCWKSAAAAGEAVVVGHTVDPDNGAVTYGVYRRESRTSKLRYRHLNDDERDGDTMNGNFVLIPAGVAAKVGNLDPVYRHAFGDVDYGLRVRDAGVRIIQSPEPVGEQGANISYARNVDTLTIRNLRFILLDPKGVPVREWLHFCRKHGGVAWPVNFLVRYAKMVVRGVAEKRT